MTSSLVAAYGTEITYEEFGTGEPVLLLHSEEGPVPTREFAEELGAERRVIMPHHPGFEGGQSLPFDAGIQDLAYAYHEFLESNDLTGIPIVGSSLGSWIALEIAALGGTAVSALHLLGPVGIKVGDREERDFVDVFAVSDQIRRELAYDDPGIAEVDVVARTEEELTVLASNREAFTKYAWEPYLHRVNLKYHVARVKVPIHIVSGAKDRLVRDGYYRELAALLGDAPVDQVSAAGHYPDIERPRETRDVVTKQMVGGGAGPR